MFTLVISVAVIKDDGNLSHEIFRILNQEALDIFVERRRTTYSEFNLKFYNLPSSFELNTAIEKVLGDRFSVNCMKVEQRK